MSELRSYFAQYFGGIVNEGSGACYEVGDIRHCNSNFYNALDTLIALYGVKVIDEMYQMYVRNEILGDDREWHKNNSEFLKKYEAYVAGCNKNFWGKCTSDIWGSRYVGLKSGADLYLNSFFFFIELSYYHIILARSSWMLKLARSLVYANYIKGRLNWWDERILKLEKIVKFPISLESFDKLYHAFQTGKLFSGDKQHHAGLGRTDTDTFGFFVEILDWHLANNTQQPQRYLTTGNESLNPETLEVVVPDSTDLDNRTNEVSQAGFGDVLKWGLLGAGAFVLWNVFKSNGKKTKRK